MSGSNLAESRDQVEGYELSPQQARLWRQRESEGSPAELWLRLPPGCDLVRLRQSLVRVLDRHEILRTRYERLPAMSLPVQVIEPAAAVHWNVAQPSDSGGVHVFQDAAEDGSSRFCVRLSGMNADAASLWRLALEWAAAYRGEPLPDVTLQYADYAAWRHELRGTDPHAAEFWDKELTRKASLTALPLRGAISLEQGAGEQASVRLALSSELCARWQEEAEARGVHPALYALGAWVTLFHQHGETDQVTLALDFQTHDAHLAGAMGLFVEPLPLTLRELGAMQARQLTNVLAARVAELEELREHFPSSADDGFYPLGFRCLPAPDQAGLSAAGFAVETLQVDHAAHLLALEYREAGSELRLVLHYDASLYDERVARLLGDQVLALLAEGLRRPDARLRELSALSEGERSQLELLGCSAALSAAQQARYDRILSLPHLMACFAGPMVSHAQRPAVRSATRSLSYAELFGQAARLARRLMARLPQGHARPRIAHFLPRDVDAVVAMLAIFQSGAAYVPVDPEYPAERIAYMLDDCGADLIVTRAELLDRLPASFRAGGRSVLTDDLTEDGPDVGWPAIDPGQPAYIIYTSGSTGQPRGVPISHASALYSLAARLAYYPEPIGAFLLLSSFAFDSSIAGLFGSLAQGGCLRLCSEVEQKDPGQLASIMRAESITHLLALPSLYQLLLEQLGDAPSAFLVGIVAGEACPRALVEQHHRTLPRARLYNEYGATEASVWSTVSDCLPAREGRPVSIGRPIPHTRVHVLDQAGEPVARGLKGELYVGGPGLSAGYLNRPELTHEKFVERAGERLYRSGDFAYWDDQGELVFLGRADGQVKIRGYRIELGEVEAALARVTLAERVVVLADRAPDQHTFLRAFVETSEVLDVARTREELARILPAPMVPSDIQALSHLPRNANGKFDRGALLALSSQHQRAPFAEPRSEAERVLAASWQELLGTAPVGRDDDFFALGGHSLLAVRLVHHIETRLQRKLPVSVLFEHPRLADMAARVAAQEPGAPGAAQADAPTSLVPLRAAGSRSPLFCVDPTGMHVSMYQALTDALPPEQPVWGLSLGAVAASRAASLPVIVQALTVALRAQGPGPYRLLGWSFGGVLALALAHTLEQAGERVAWLGILDSQPPSRLYAAREPDVFEELAEYVDVDRKSELLALPATERHVLRAMLLGLSGDDRVMQAVAWAQERGLVRDQTAPSAFLHRYALLKGGAQYLNALPPGSLAAELHVWWSQDTVARHGGPPIDYQRYTRSACHSYSVKGDHVAVVQSAFVHAQIAALLSKSLRKESP